MPGRILLVGGGEGGLQLARVLMQSGRRVRVLEVRPSALLLLRQKLGAEAVVSGSGTDPGALEAAGIRDASVLVALTGSDATNLAAAQLARFAFQVPRTVARVNSPRHAWLFQPELGVDLALDQSEILARMLTGELPLATLLSLLRLRLGNDLIQELRIGARSPAAGQSLQQLDLPATCSIVAVLREGEVLVPRGGTVLQVGDEVLALVHGDPGRRLAALLTGPGT